MRRILLFSAMLAVVALTAIVLYVDARREGAAALEDFARDQATLAGALAAPGAAPKLDQGEVFVEQRADGKLARADGVIVDSAAITSAMASGARTVTLSRPQAVAIGLPERLAVAGIAKRSDGHSIAVASSALRVRDREFRARDRLLLGIVLAALVAFGFGGIALRVQRKEHLLERELDVERAEKRSEDRLARADKLATMGAFATGIAHEIATPLGVIAARTEMLASPTDERATRAAKTIGEQVEKIRGIIESFLVLARGEPARHAPIDARELVMSAKAMVEHRFGAAGVGLDVEAGSVDRGLVSGERRLLEQALVNLLLNAESASKSGQRVKLSIAVGGDDHICFSVTDDGVGIAPEVAARATEPFFTTKPAGHGTGLGLAIVNEIAKHHQGRFTIAPRTSGGTEARLELPSLAKEKAA